MIIARMALQSGTDAQYIAGVVLTASRRYKTYFIPKRNGARRRIDHPARELKFLQHWLLRNLLANLPVHSAATAYAPGSSILQNARAHANQNYLLKIDFADFFPSLRSVDVINLINHVRTMVVFADLSDSDVGTISNIVCKDGALTIGAPTSPILSNALLFDFDAAIYSYCSLRGIVYTRYADDITLSSNVPDVLSHALEFVREASAGKFGPSLRLNETKTFFTSRKRRRVVTGLVLTSQSKVSLGRGKKRQIKSLVFRWTKGETSAGEIAYLRGYLAFVRSVEPDFLRTLETKYGARSIAEIEGATLAERKGLGAIQSKDAPPRSDA